MTKLLKKISAPLISLIFLLNMSSAGNRGDNSFSRSWVYF